ncbi:MAG: serine/threonine-protein kinase [Snowella sp.]|nr:serine/threonine-protein kinase [Snowella sp.]
MFKTGDILHQRYLLKQPLGHSGNNRQTWLAIDLKSHQFGFLWRWEKLNNLDWLNLVKLLAFQRSPQLVTLKLLAFSPQLQWSEFKLFEREAEVLQNLNHPRIPHYHDSFEIDQQNGSGVTWFALTQDYLHGFSLAELIHKNRTFSESDLKKIAQEILNILVYLHESNPPILHRDLKPSNLILGTDGHIYLIDFGAVQANKTVTGVTFTVVGSSGYTPLEQYWGKAVPASDLYGLGATLIHLLTGRSPETVIAQQSGFVLDDQIAISRPFKQWLARLTHPIVEKRYQSATEALETLLSLDNPFHFGQKVVEQTQKLIQPRQSRIKLSYSESVLTLKLASGQFRLWDTLLGKTSQSNSLTRLSLWGLMIWSLAIAPSLMGLNYYLTPNKSFVFWELELILLLNLGIVLLTLVIDLIFGKLSKTQLILADEQYQISQTILGITYQKARGKRQDIMGVFAPTQSDQQHLSFTTPDQIYPLGKDLDPAEAAWIVQEIRDWLYRSPE